MSESSPTDLLTPSSTSAVSTPTSAPSPLSNPPTPSSLNFGTTTAPRTKSHLALQPTKAIIKPVSSRTALPQAANAAPVNKMSMASVISPMPAPSAAKPPMSMTSKEWVIPPRPKPGRKPATDTPPTKRKAQNRAAQRAFRERRAARVGELEEQLDAEKEEHDKTERELHDKIHSLEVDAQALQSRCEVLENMLDKERAERAREVESLTRRLHEANQTQRQQQERLPSVHTYAPTPSRYHHRQSAPSLSHDGRDSRSSLPSITPSTARRRSKGHAFSISQIISPPEDIEQAPVDCGNCGPAGPCACADNVMATLPVGCGNCTLGSRCECLEEVFSQGVNNNTNNFFSKPSTPAEAFATKAPKRTIRSISPSSMAPDEKRQRGNDTSATEIDFTTMFSRKPNRVASSMSQSMSAPTNNAGTPNSNAPSPYPSASAGPQSVTSPQPATEDRCGFCEDGTYCACADAAANAIAGLAPADSSLTLPAIQSVPISYSRPQQGGQQTRMTPPPSEDDAVPYGYEIMPDGSVKLPGVRALQSRNKATSSNSTLPKPSGGCGPGGPGTCAQCLMDPISGLFCRSLAANFKKQNGEGSGGCCGGAGPGAGCCKSKNANNTPPAPTRTVSAPGTKKDLGLSLSCADAYKTLASHRHFDEAADDIGTWLPLLRAAPKPREPAVGGGRDTGGSSRTPIEVEAASIMSVLKGFDVRFGRGE